MGEQKDADYEELGRMVANQYRMQYASRFGPVDLDAIQKEIDDFYADCVSNHEGEF